MKLLIKKIGNISTKVNIQSDSNELIEHDENNIDMKRNVEPGSIFFKTNKHNNNRSKRKFEYSKNKCTGIVDSEQYDSNGHSHIKTKIITAKSNYSTTHIDQYGTSTKDIYKNNYEYPISYSNSRNLTKEYPKRTYILPTIFITICRYPICRGLTLICVIFFMF